MIQRAKKCSKCGLVKVLECFHVHHVRADGTPVPRARCRVCYLATEKVAERRRYSLKRARVCEQRRAKYHGDREYRARVIAANTLRTRRRREAAIEERAMDRRRVAA